MLTGVFDSVDDMLHAVYGQLVHGTDNFQVTSTKGDSVEHLGAILRLDNPRARLSRSVDRARVFSALGEFIWYVSCSNSIEQIEYYLTGYSEFSDDGLTANGAYGPRVFGPASPEAGSPQSLWNQALTKLSKPDGHGTRNAVIPILRAEDLLKDTKDRPCTCVLQLFIRNDQLIMHAHMRSNDAYIGLPHDVFSFTMLQEIAASHLNKELGPYFHSVSSLHLYSDETGPPEIKATSSAKRYLDEGLHSPVPMGRMPDGDPWSSLSVLVSAERELRRGNLDFDFADNLPPYWQDYLTLLKAYAAIKQMEGETRVGRLNECLTALNDKSLNLYILDKLQTFSHSK